jgi:hypothetical protein
MQKHKDLDRLHKHYSSMLAASKNHNILLGEASAQGILDIEPCFWERVNEYLEGVRSEINGLKELYTDSNAYAAKLAELLTARSIPSEHEGSSIDIGPINVTVNLEDFNLLIKIGRKKQQITDLELSKVVKLVETLYKRLNSTFNASAFFKRLQKAYIFANTRMYSCQEPKYGYSVALKDLFDLFSLSPAAADYKLENFLWDLGRLNSSGSSFDRFRIELGFSRDVRKMYLIRTASGETIKASTLTIHLIAADE